MSAGALKAPDPALETLKSPHIASHRYDDANLPLRDHLLALHGANGHHKLGVFSTAQRVPWADRPWQEKTHSVERIESAAATLAPGTPDLYISQQSFWRWRRIASLKHLGCCYADLDYRKLRRWEKSKPEEVLWSAMRTLDDTGVPLPTYVLSTGNGLCMVWLHSFVPRAALPRWTAMQRVLAETLVGYGADKKAMDAARVFRAAGSINSRARDWRNEIVRPLYLRDAPELLRQASYQFDELADQLLPLARAELMSLRAERAKRRAERDAATPGKPTSILTQASYYEAVLTDFQRLRYHRYGEDGELPPGQRDEWLFVASSSMAHLAPPQVLEREIAALAREAAGWNDKEAASRMSSVIRRAHLSTGGGTVLDLHGEPVDPKYRFRADTIVQRLEISPGEMEEAGLRALIDKDRRRKLNTERTRESRHRRGAKPRVDAQAARLQLGIRAISLAATGATIAQIATIEGVSSFQVSTALREAKEKTLT